MNEKTKTPEPLAAILTDYRADIPAMTSGELPHPTPEYLRILLDRIEAAVGSAPGGARGGDLIGKGVLAGEGAPPLAGGVAGVRFHQ